MKKNRMLRLASTLMILTLLTTSIIGGTFAKYTTTGRASDTARVAKWGVAITASGSLYSDAYAKGTTENSLPTAWDKQNNTFSDSISVAAVMENDNIVAPGTKSYGNGLSFGITGKPEVAGKVSATITAEDIFLDSSNTYGTLVLATVHDDESLMKVMGTGTTAKDVYFAPKSGDISYTKCTGSTAYNANNNYYILTSKVKPTTDYFPVKYKLFKSDGSATLSDKKAIDIAKELAKNVNGGTEGTVTNNADHKATYTVTHSFKADTNLETDTSLAVLNEMLQWEWAFHDTEEKDKMDTILGNLIAARQAQKATTDEEKTNDPQPDTVVVVCNMNSTETEKVDSVTALTFTDDDFTVKDSNNKVVANLQTKFDITLTVEQVD